jgi:hypothetical protein
MRPIACSQLRRFSQDKSPVSDAEDLNRENNAYHHFGTDNSSNPAKDMFEILDDSNESRW